MAIRSFTVGPSKGLQLAELQNAPNLMAIVGPNGSGKSTLLYELERNRGSLIEPGTRVIYMNPNRPWRRTTFGVSFLYNLPYSYRQLMEMENFPGFQNYQPPGFVHSGLPRSPDNVDDVQSLVKFSIARLETKRQQAISSEFDSRGGQIPPGALPEIFAPLRSLVSALLPHLRFSHLDMVSNANNILCYFEKLDATSPVMVEMDDLSSGEKAVLQLFLPFIEDQIERRLPTAGSEESSDQVAIPTAIIDEPELHLHPALQVALVAYLRQLADANEAQFLIATHATAIMDALEDEELYLLAPPAFVGPGNNQLIRLASNNERLDAIRLITGSTYAVTRCRPIVFIEGETVSGSSGVTDQRLLEILVPEAKGWVVVPSSGRSEAIKASQRLRDPSLTHLPGISVFALVDRDETEASTDDFVVQWPVCMIENLLLDPSAIWDFIEPMKERVGLMSAADVQKVLDGYCDDQVEREVELRVLRRVRPLRITTHIRRSEDFDALADTTAEDVRNHLERVGPREAIEATVFSAKAEVQEILNRGEAFERFHGKEILRRFYDDHAKHGGWSYLSFCYGLATTIRLHDDSAYERVAQSIRRIRQYVPADLVLVLREAAEALGQTEHGDEAEEAAAAVQDARDLWETGIEDEQDRSRLRERLSSVAMKLGQASKNELRDRILALLVEFGT